MNRLGFWLADKLALALEPHERDAVCGDQAELKASGMKAAGEVFGLVLRRQLEAWKHWRTWVVLLGIVVPFVALHTLISIRLGRQLLEGARFVQPLVDEPLHWVILRMLTSYRDGFSLIFIALWSWTGGFAASAIAIRSRLSTFVVCLLVWLSASILSPDRSLSGYVFNFVAFWIPAFYGFRLGMRRKALSLPIAGLLIAAPGLTAAAMSALLITYESLSVGLSFSLGICAFSWPALWIFVRSFRVHRERHA